MAVLHLIFRSPAESSSLSQCLARVGQGDALLLLGDAVYAVAGEALPAQAWAGLKAYVVVTDLLARGLSPSALPAGFITVDYDGFVELTEHYPLSLSWF